MISITALKQTVQLGLIFSAIKGSRNEVLCGATDTGWRALVQCYGTVPYQTKLDKKDFRSIQSINGDSDIIKYHCRIDHLQIVDIIAQALFDQHPTIVLVFSCTKGNVHGLTAGELADVDLDDPSVNRVFKRLDG